MSRLRIAGLSKTFGGRNAVPVLDRVSIDVDAGELLVLLGPSGCGKTTLLRCVAGLEEAQQGSISFSGTKVFDAETGLNLPTYKRDIGMVFQNYSLWPHMNVRRNVEYPLRMRNMRADERDRRVAETLRIVHCEDLADRLPSMLSGGQQQRIALARALASRPSLMLFDEPLSNLDALLRLELSAQLRGIHRELGFSGIYVTHDQAEAFSLGTRIAVMNAGTVEQIGTPHELYARPATEFVATFFGFSNSLTFSHNGEWASAAGRLTGDLGILGAPRERLRLFAKPLDVKIGRSEELVLGEGMLAIGGGRVVDAVFGGGVIDYILQFGDTRLTARTLVSETGLAPGDPVDIAFSRKNALLYANGRLETF